VHTREWREKQSEKMRNNNPMKNPAIVEKMSKTMERLYREGKLVSPLKEKKYIEAYGAEKAESIKEKISKAMKGKPNPKTSKVLKKLYAEGKIKPYSHWKGKKNPGHAKFMKQHWQNSEYRERTIKAQMRRLFKRPTSLEKRFIKLIKNHNLPFAYCGNGSLLVGWKNPDFYETNGKKICIEVANHYHHPYPWAEKRIQHFAKFGWKCLIFFGDKKNKFDLPKKEIIEKIRGFVDG